jgi:hypothetical protein
VNITWVRWKLWFQILNLGHRCIIDCQNYNLSLCGNIMALIETILMVKHVELKIWSTSNKQAQNTINNATTQNKTQNTCSTSYVLESQNNENETPRWTMRKYCQKLNTMFNTLNKFHYDLLQFIYYTDI